MQVAASLGVAARAAVGQMAAASDVAAWEEGAGGEASEGGGSDGGGGGGAWQALCPLCGLMLTAASSLISKKAPPIRSSVSRMKASVETMMINIIPIEMNLAALL